MKKQILASLLALMSFGAMAQIKVHSNNNVSVGDIPSTPPLK